MKRLYNAVNAICIAIALSMVSCEKPYSDNLSDETEIILKAEFADSTPGTKNTITDDTVDPMPLSWLEGDAINVFFGNSKSSKFTTEVSGRIAEFSGSINGVVGGVEGATQENFLWGVYPYSSKTTCDGSSVIYTLPSVQTAVAGTFADDLYPAIARSQNFYMSFYNICGGFRFKVSNPDIVKVTLKGNKGEALAGKAKITMDGYPVVEEILEGSTELTMTAPDGGCFETDKYYYFVAYPIEFSEGLTITYHKEDSQADYVVSKAYILPRSKFSSFTNRDAGLTFEKVDEEVDNQNIVFADAVMKELCVNAFDTNGDGELAYREAAAVTDLSQMKLTKKTFKSFDEFQYFTNVKAIPYEYFKGIGIKSIVLPESLKYIRNGAFYGCSSLTSVKIPESVTSIEGSAFYGCSSLTSVTIPESVTSIGGYAFSGCSSLTSVTIPESVTSIRSGAFDGCSSLTSVTIPESVTSIGSFAFFDCSNLTSVYVRGLSPCEWGRDIFLATPLEVIYVPLGAEESYKTAEGWSEYADIIKGYDFENNKVVE